MPGKEDSPVSINPDDVVKTQEALRKVLGGHDILDEVGAVKALMYRQGLNDLGLTSEEIESANRLLGSYQGLELRPEESEALEKVLALINEQRIFAVQRAEQLKTRREVINILVAGGAAVVGLGGVAGFCALLSRMGLLEKMEKADLKFKKRYEIEHALGSENSAESVSGWVIRHPLQERVTYTPIADRTHSDAQLTIFNGNYIRFADPFGSTNISLNGYVRSDGKIVPQFRVLSRSPGYNNFAEERIARHPDDPDLPVDPRVIIFEQRKSSEVRPYAFRPTGGLAFVATLMQPVRNS